MIPIIHEPELRASVTPAHAVAAIREAFRADGEGRTQVPQVINLEIAAARGEFHVKTAHIQGVPHVAVKIASGFFDNPSRGLPSGSGLMAVFDAATGPPRRSSSTQRLPDGTSAPAQPARWRPSRSRAKRSPPSA